MAIQFALNGKEISFDWDTEEYTNLRARYFRERGKLLQQLYCDVDSADETVENTENIGHALIGCAVALYSTFGDLYMERGHFDFSEKKLTEDSAFESSIVDPVADIVTDIQSILKNAENYKEAQSERRALRMECRSRVIGGGFGFEGFVKGALTAGAINTVTGVAHGMFNMVGNIATAIKVSGIKSEAYKKFKNEIKEKAPEILDAVRVIVVRQLELKLNINASSAKTIMENIHSGKIKDEFSQAAIMKAIEYFPYDVVCYEEYLERVPSAEEDIYNLAAHFQLPVQIIKDNIHNYDGFYFDVVSDKKLILDMVRFIDNLVSQKYPADSYLNDYVRKKSDEYSKGVLYGDTMLIENAGKMCREAYLYDERFWETNLDSELLDKVISKVEETGKGNVSPQVEGFVKYKLLRLNTIKEKICSQVDEISEVFNNYYFQDIVKAIIICVSSDKSYHIAKLPKMKMDDSEMNSAFRGYLKEFNIKRENVYLLCDDPDSDDSGHAHGFAITYDGFFNSNGYYYFFDQIVDAKVVDKDLYLKDASGKDNYFMSIQGNDTAEYFNKIFSYIFHPETIPCEVLNFIKEQLKQG